MKLENHDWNIQNPVHKAEESTVVAADAVVLEVAVVAIAVPVAAAAVSTRKGQPTPKKESVEVHHRQGRP